MLTRSRLLLGLFSISLLILTGCNTSGGNITPTPEITPTPTLQSLVYEPTNPAGFYFPFNLSSITLTCTSKENYLLEFDYLPLDITILSVSDPNNTSTNLSCSSRSNGHEVCSGNIDFGTLGVVGLRVCEGKNPLSQICISQTVRPAQCPAAP